MKNYLLLPLFCSLLLLAGCNTDKEPNNAEPIKMQISGRMITTGATGTENFSAGSKTGLYMTLATASLSPSGNLADNLVLTADGAGALTASSALKYPETGNISLYSYAPHSSDGIDAAQDLTFTVAADQSVTASSDLLWAKSENLSVASTAADLVFAHKLAKIIITLTAGEGVTLFSPTVQVVGTLPTVKMNLKTGALGIASGSGIVIETSKVSATEFCAIIVPQTVATEAALLTINNGGKTHTYTMTESKNFESSKVYTYQIKVNNNNIEVKFTGSIGSWTTGDTTTGDAI